MRAWQERPLCWRDWLRDDTRAALGDGRRCWCWPSARRRVVRARRTPTGRSPSYLVHRHRSRRRRARSRATFGSTLESDVVTNVKVTVGGQEVLQPTIYEDLGQVTLRMVLKDAGSANAP